MATVRDCGFRLIGHPFYSPDIAPSDLAGRRLTSEEQVMTAVVDSLDYQHEVFYRTGIQAM